MNQKVFTTFFLILIFNELFTFKSSDEWQHLKMGSSTLELGGNQTVVYAVRQSPLLSLVLPRLSDQKICMKCYLILRKLHRTCKVFLKIILRP